MEINTNNLEKFSKFIGIDKNILLKAYELEKKFHEKIINEYSYEKRKELYKEIYSKVHHLYGKDKPSDLNKSISIKKKVAFLFKKELYGKSVLDVGCGDGAFLYAIDSMFPHKKLTGIDISTITPDSRSGNISFINSDVILFDTGSQYDTIILDNVYEHISIYDKDLLFNSINKNLIPGGILIMIIPNRLFGPSDVTRVIDFSYSGNTPSQGTHLNETTYTDIISELSSHGYYKILSPIPFRKLKYFSFGIRFPSRWFSWIENNKTILNIIKRFKVHGQSFFRFEVIIIAKKK
jgi:2-polyprenyl-3-methyl-5-hydroxy-6-metoxy-1,4-benzoquinol methylase